MKTNFLKDDDFEQSKPIRRYFINMSYIGVITINYWSLVLLFFKIY